MYVPSSTWSALTAVCRCGNTNLTPKRMNHKELAGVVVLRRQTTNRPMRSIYAALATLLLIITTATAGFAQSKSKHKAKPKEVITRTIIGCTLGESTIDQIKQKIQEQNGKIDTIDHGIEGPRVQVILASDIPFFGKNRNDVVLQTVDGVLYSVSFLIDDKDEANRLKSSLSAKYKDWRDADIDDSEPYHGGFADDKSAVLLSYKNNVTYGGDFKHALLIYWDKALYKKAEEIERTDL